MIKLNVLLLRRICLFLLLCLGFSVRAHPPGLSSAEITLNSKQTKVVITFALQDIEALFDLDTDRDAEVTPAELQQAKSQIAQFATEALAITVDGDNTPVTSASEVIFDDKNNVIISTQLDKAVESSISIISNVISKLPKGHRQFTSLKNHQGHLIAERMLNSSSDVFEITLKNTPDKNLAEEKISRGNTFLEFLKLGIEHILTGYDHLLFLLALLSVVRGFWPSVKIITAFTIAHSITLALAALNVIEIPGSIIEPLIAITIIYVGFENLIRTNPAQGRWILTFFFGLIHGFGFAGVLREMGINSGDWGIAIPLFSFNLGVEIGQICIAAVVLPIVGLLLKSQKLSQLWVTTCSVLVILAGSFWLYERVWLTT